MIISLGEILVDRIADTIGNDISLIQHWTELPGGAPANVACALQRLGTESAFLGAIGNDEVGDRLLSCLERYGVNLDLVQRCDFPTRQVSVTRSAEGDREFAGFGRLSHSAFADTQLQYRQHDQSHFQQAKFFYLGTLALAEKACRQSVDQYLQLAQSLKIPCFMDVNWRPMFWGEIDVARQIILERLHQVSFVKVTDEEATWLFECQSPQVICERYPHLQGVFVTRGKYGCDYQVSGFSGTMPGFEVESIDTTGAGDGFVAGCLHQLCDRDSIQAASDAEALVHYANAVGALTTLQLGAIAPHPTAEDVLKFLATLSS